MKERLVEARDQIRAEIEEKEMRLAEQADEFTRHQLEWEATITPEFRATLPGPTQAAIDLELAERGRHPKAARSRIVQDDQGGP